MKLILQSLLLLSFSFVTSGVTGQPLPIPEKYSIVDSVFGDLDKDGKNELVIAYNTTEEVEDSTEDFVRELIIYKLNNGEWKPWKSSKQALYSSRGGGMMGDPFEEMTISKGILQISHYGGSSWKWGHTDKYRFQDNEFYLIGYSSSYGKPCENWTEVDFNISTGKMIVKKEYEECEDGYQKISKRENETVIKKGLKITLQNRNEREIKIITPAYKHEIYLAMGQ